MSQHNDNNHDNTVPSDTDEHEETASLTVDTDEKRHPHVEISEQTYQKWRKAVIKKHGKYREAHTIEAERALRSHADAILGESDPSNDEIMRELEDIKAAVTGGDSETPPTPSDAPSVTQKTSAGETDTSPGDPADPLARDEIGVTDVDDIDWDKLANEYNHNTCIEPDPDVDWDGLVKQRSKYRVPVTIGWINYRQETEGLEWLEESELTEWLQELWGWSVRQSAYRHRNRLVSHGVIRPSPWIRFRDEDDNPELVDWMKQRMASRGHAVSSADDLREMEKSRWPGIRDIVEHVNAGLVSTRYYVDMDTYARDVWAEIVNSVEQLDEAEKHNNRTDKYGPVDATPFNRVQAFVPWLERVVREWYEQVLDGEDEWAVNELTEMITDAAADEGDAFDRYDFRKFCERVEGMLWQDAVTDEGEDWRSRLVQLVASADSTEEIRRLVRDAESADEVVVMVQELADDWGEEEMTPAFEVLVEVLDEVAEDVRAPDADARLASRPSEPGVLINKRL